MIVVRDVFELEFGMAKDAIALLKEGRTAAQESGYAVTRLSADLTGPFYTLVMESTFDGLAQYEEALEKVSDNGTWKEIYGRLVPLVRSGRREVYRVVE